MGSILHPRLNAPHEAFSSRLSTLINFLSKVAIAPNRCVRLAKLSCDGSSKPLMKPAMKLKLPCWISPERKGILLNSLVDAVVAVGP